MNNITKRVSTDLILKIFIHLIFWFFFVILPLLNSKMDEDHGRYKFLTSILPATIFCVPFFYINSEFLIKKFLPKGKITGYIISLSVLFFVFLFSYYLIKKSLISQFPIKIYDSRTVWPVLLVLSMSTLFGFIDFMLSQSRINEEKNAERLKSELSFLRSQISPHFIFNILNSIVYLIRSKSSDAEKVTIELSELIRYMLYDSENRQVPLEKEVEYLKNYIELQKIRFGEDVAINLTVEGNLNGKMIEPMLLIPFVENAFKHGVGFVSKPFIDVFVDCNGNSFNFNVKNLVGPEDDDNKDEYSGIGLKNVKRRLELLYEDSQSLIINDENGVFEARLKLELK